jgi:3-oxoacyl-[acyl-carrier-protein] synthase II
MADSTVAISPVMMFAPPTLTTLATTCGGARNIVPPVVSIKGVTGHPLGAAGALEAASVLLSFEKKLIPPTRGTTVVDPALDIDVVIGDPRPWSPGPTISNNFGFGGHNGSVILTPFAGA